MLPIIMFILLGIIDFSRVFTSQLVVESAVREAADFGAFSSSNWIGDPADATSNYAKTVSGMTERVCLATRSLTDYVGSGATCSYPVPSIQLVDKNGSPASGCADPSRNSGPCWVRVDMDYTLDIIVPIRIDFFGTRLGLPDSLTFNRSSTFAISDFSVDQP